MNIQFFLFKDSFHVNGFQLDAEFVAESSATTEITTRRRETVTANHKRLTELFKSLQVGKSLQNAREFFFSDAPRTVIKLSSFCKILVFIIFFVISGCQR